jgi:hypothetical protein
MRPMRFSALMLIVPLVAEGGKSNKDSIAQPHATCPDEVPSKGIYVNHSYGFSIFIPDGLAGFWNSARCVSQANECTCMSDHGRIIPLSKRINVPDRQIEAYADYGSDLENGTVAEAVASELRAIRGSSVAGTMTVFRREVIKLSALKARRVAVKYRDKQSKNWMVEDFVDAMRKDVRYFLYLRTPQQEYAQDRTAFDRIVGSFALVHEDQNQ